MRCISFVLFLFSTLFAQTDNAPRSIEATGMGSIIGGDVAMARDDAIDDAMRNGLEKAMGTLVQSETLVENFQLVEDNIFSKTSGYIQTYDVIREGKKGEDLYEVAIQAVVKMADLKSDLDAIATLIRRKNTPRMMVLIDETNVGETPGLNPIRADLNSAENAIMEQFMAKGFRFVDQVTIKANLDRATAAALLEGNAVKAASLARSFGAEVIVTGKAVAKAVETTAFGATIRSQQATVTARAIRTDTGDIIATGSAQDKYPHIDDMTGGVKAIEKAGVKLSDDLMAKILAQWQTDVNMGGTMALHVNGISGYSQLSKLQNSMKYYVRGVNSVSRREFSGSRAVFEINMKGNADDLAARLDGKNIEGIQVRVVGVTQNSVTIEVQ